jgi:hypothetical protein
MPMRPNEVASARLYVLYDVLELFYQYFMYFLAEISTEHNGTLLYESIIDPTHLKN